MEQVVIYSVVVLGGMGLVIGLLLSVASRALAVKTDPNVWKILKALPNVNCGACGYPGCQGFAEAIAKGEADPAACAPGGQQVADEIAEIMGLEAREKEKVVALIHCRGGSKCGKAATYYGLESCTSANLAGFGPSACVFGCLAMYDCIHACPFDAIYLDENEMAVVDREKCVACGKCIEICPRSLIELVPVDRTCHILCSSKDRGKAVTSICEYGCIGCTKCVKACQSDAIHMEEGLAVIDYEKCTNCGACAEACPVGAISSFAGKEVSTV